MQINCCGGHFRAARVSQRAHPHPHAATYALSRSRLCQTASETIVPTPQHDRVCRRVLFLLADGLKQACRVRGRPHGDAERLLQPHPADPGERLHMCGRLMRRADQENDQFAGAAVYALEIDRLGGFPEGGEESRGVGGFRMRHGESVADTGGAQLLAGDDGLTDRTGGRNQPRVGEGAHQLPNDREALRLPRGDEDAPGIEELAQQHNEALYRRGAMQTSHREADDDAHNLPSFRVDDFPGTEILGARLPFPLRGQAGSWWRGGEDLHSRA